MLLLVLPVFASPNLISRDIYSHVARVGDVNGDGFADIAASNCATGTVDLYLGSVDGLMEAASVVTGGCEIAGAGDQDQDGSDEVLVGDSDANGGDGAIYLYQGAGLTLWKTWNGSGGEGLGAAIAGLGDVNGDGKDDFGAISWIAVSSSPGLDRLSVWEDATASSASWTWEESVAPSLWPASEAPFLAPVDADGDGNADPVVLSRWINNFEQDTANVVGETGTVTTLAGPWMSDASTQMVAGRTAAGSFLWVVDSAGGHYDYDLNAASVTTAFSSGISGYGRMDAADPEDDGLDTWIQVQEENAWCSECVTWNVDIAHGSYAAIETSAYATPSMRATWMATGQAILWYWTEP